MNPIFKNRLLLTFTLICFAIIPGFAQQNKWTVQNIELNKNWKIQSSAKETASEKEISSTSVNTESWYAAQVPGSILGSLVADSVYKNIFFGRNLDERLNRPKFLTQIPHTS